jgi:hypothetical protein
MLKNAKKIKKADSRIGLFIFYIFIEYEFIYFIED